LRQGVLEGCRAALSVWGNPIAFQMSLWAHLVVTTEHGVAYLLSTDNILESFK
jgi:hypothetical protein